MTGVLPKMELVMPPPLTHRRLARARFDRHCRYLLLTASEQVSAIRALRASAIRASAESSVVTFCLLDFREASLLSCHHHSVAAASPQNWNAASKSISILRLRICHSG